MIIVSPNGQPRRVTIRGLRSRRFRIEAGSASAAEPVEVHFRWRPQLPDPSDELVLEAAANGQADALITHNVRDFEHAAARFDLRVVAPQQCLKEIKR